jgi:hypothetical protein
MSIKQFSSIKTLTIKGSKNKINWDGEAIPAAKRRIAPALPPPGKNCEAIFFTTGRPLCKFSKLRQSERI